MNNFLGTGVAMITPFKKDGSVDYVGLKNLINYTIQGGVDYLVSLGTTGESATLTTEERQTIWKFTVDVVSGRVPLVAGIGGNSTYEVIETLKSFTHEGFDAILSVSPYYNKPSQEGIYAHYKAIAEISPLPIILYNVPGRTGSNIAAETTLKLAHEFKNIIGIKEASGNFDQFNEIIQNKPKNFMFISGDDPITLPLISMGAVGVISVVGNALPKLFSQMVRLCLKGDFDAARPLNYRMINFTRLLFTEGNPSGVKAALSYLKICEKYLRLPLVSSTSDNYEKIAKELAMLNK